MVLRPSVAYNTEKATLPLTGDQRSQADDLSRQAQQVNRAGQYGDALRFLCQGLAVMRNVPWTPALEFASSLPGKLDHAIIEPGAHVTVTLTPLYKSPRAADVRLIPSNRPGARLFRQATQGSGASIAGRRNLPPRSGAS